MADLNRIAILIVAVALVSAMGISDGGTVTLTGTCTSAILTPSSNSITFSISNSGNDSAVGVSVTPVFPGMSVAATGSSQTLLPPGGILSYLFESSGMPENGSYAGHFYVTYDQGQSQFHAIFPCMVDIGGIATSDITVSSVKQLQNGSIVVAVDNSGNASPVALFFSKLGTSITLRLAFFARMLISVSTPNPFSSNLIDETALLEKLLYP